MKEGVKINIYAVRIPKHIPNHTINLILNSMSAERRIKALSYRLQEDRYKSMLADILARSVICDMFNIRNSDISFLHNEYGKPYVANLPDLFYNISHSGSWVVGVFSDKTVGIDIEAINLVDIIGIARRFFSNEEYEHIMQSCFEHRQELFYDIWTLKESYIKAIGKGLTIPLDSFTIDLENEDSIVVEDEENGTYFLKRYEFDENYKLAVCSEGRSFPENINVLPIGHLLDSIC